MPDTIKPGLHARFKLLTLPVRAAFWIGLLTLIFSVLGFLVLPPVAKMVLEKKLPTVLHRPVSIGKITLNPFRLEVAIENFHIGQKDGPGDLVAFDRLVVNLESASIFKRALIIQAISLTGPKVEFSRINEQTYNFSDLLTEDPAKKAAPPEKTKPFQFAIRNIEIKGGRIIFHDLPKKTDHSVTELNLGVPSLSNLPYQVETYVQPAFSATINGTPFALGGQSKPFAKSLESVMELKANGINVPEYLAYIPNPTSLLLQSALLDVDARLLILARPDNTYRLAVIGRVALRDLAIADKAGQTYLKIPELAVTLADSDLLAQEVHLSEVSVKSPTVNLERLTDGRILPVALLTPADQQPADRGAAPTPANSAKTEPDDGPSLKLDIDKVLLTAGQINFKDATAGATVSTRLDIDTTLHMQGQPDKSSRLAVLGRVALHDLALADKAGKAYLKLPELVLTLAETNLLANEIHLSEINLQTPTVKIERLADGRLLPLALLVPPETAPGKGAKGTPGQVGKAEQTPASPLKLEVDKVVLNDGRVDYLDGAAGSTVSTRLNIDTSMSYLTQADNPPRLAVIGRVALRNLALADKGGKSYFKFSELALNLADANLLANEVHFSEINLKSPTVNLERRADGSLLPMALLIPAAKQPETQIPPPTHTNPENSTKDTAEALKLAIDKLVLSNGLVDFLDLAGAAGVEPTHLTLRDLNIQIANLSNTPEAMANLALSGKINETAKLQIKGQLGLEPFQSRVNLQLMELALNPFQAYISEQANIIIVGGNLSVSGDLALRSPKVGGLKSDFQGEAAINNLATVDTILGEDLVKWRNLGFKKIHFSSDPGLLSVASINLTDPYINVLFGKVGVLNLTTIVPEKAVATPTAPEIPPASAEVAATKPFTTNIGSITISGGQLDFIDRQVDPAYGTSLSELSGSVSDLSSMEESSADVKFSAKLDQQAPMNITGRINPLRKDLFVDLKVDFADINLSPMSPYGGKFIGYKIDKGKLNLDLKYDIANRKLNSQNKVFLDQFTLGQTVDSPDAANLPIRLALALLRDRKGGINLDLPVEGSLDDPSFKIGKVVIQVLINLISKAVTSPMALLGSLIPAGQDIQFIAFEAGRSEITPESLAKLTTAEKVLFERPELRMDLIGKVDPAADTTALARQQLSTSIKLQKLLASGKAGKDAAAQVDGVELSAAEYPTFLTLAYQASQKAAKAPKPAKGTPPPDIATMESSLLSGIKVGEDELRLLALARANKVLGALVAGGKIEPGRLFVIEPKVGKAGDAAAISQVELVIK